MGTPFDAEFTHVSVILERLSTVRPFATLHVAMVLDTEKQVI